MRLAAGLVLVDRQPGSGCVDPRSGSGVCFAGLAAALDASFGWSWRFRQPGYGWAFHVASRRVRSSAAADQR